MIPAIPEEFYDYLDENEVLKLKEDAPYKIKKRFENGLKSLKKNMKKG